MQVSDKMKRDVYIKKYIKKEPNIKRHHGLGYRESFNLELACLQRLLGYSNFCQLINADIDTTTLTLKWAGHNFNYYIDPIRKYEKYKRRAKKQGLTVISKPPLNNLVLTRLEFEEQIYSVFEIFKKQNVVHFDLGPWNICVENHTITIIDFGCAVLDGEPSATCLEKPYENFVLNGGWNAQQEQLLQRINSKLKWN
jgi:hypothetical protein